jgi:hypothetical protein
MEYFFTVPIYKIFSDSGSENFSYNTNVIISKINTYLLNTSYKLLITILYNYTYKMY